MLWFLGHLDFVHYRRTGDLIALKWSLLETESVAGGRRLVGQEVAWGKWEETKQPTLLARAHLQGGLRLQRSSQHQRTFTQGFLVWEMFLLFHTYTDSMQVLYPGDLLSHSISFQGPE